MSGSGGSRLFDDTGKFVVDSKGSVQKGRTEYDALGNAVWVPYKGLTGKDAIAKLLNDDTLAITEDEAKGTTDRIHKNPSGTRKGYDPLDSGLLTTTERKRPKDLRALSDWILRRRKFDPKR